MPTQRLAAFLFAIVMGWSAAPVLAYQREIQAAADSIGEKLAASGKRSVAVVDFTDLQGSVTELGRFLAEELSVALASASRPLEVVDRTHLKVLLQEHKLSATGLIDPATAKKLGQIAGVDALVTGSLTPFGDTVRLTLRVLDTSTARIVAASTAEIAKTKAIEELVARGVGGSAPASEPPGAGSKTTPPPGMPPPIEQEGFRFTLQTCRYSGGSLRRDFLVENLTSNTKDLFLAAGAYVETSYLYDDAGNQYERAEVSLGREGVTRQEVIPGIPIAGRIVFSGVPSGLRRVSLSLAFSSDRLIRIILRRVPL